MAQKIISIVVSLNDEVLFESNNCTPQQLMSCLTLFDKTGTKFDLEIKETDLPIQPSSKE